MSVFIHQHLICKLIAQPLWTVVC